MRILLPLLGLAAALTAVEPPVEAPAEPLIASAAPSAPAGERLPPLLANRRGAARAATLVERGVAPANEAAVAAALAWLKRHQSPEGLWDVAGYPVLCPDVPKAEPGTEHTGADGDIGCTAFALLAFLGAGHDHRLPGPHRTTVAKGIDWLLATQAPGTGLLGTRNYEHPLATAALCEALALTRDARLKVPAQRAVDALVARQSKDAKGVPLGWDYVMPTMRIDASTSGWCILALVAADAAGLRTGRAPDGAQVYLDRAWRAANRDPGAATTSFPYTWNVLSDEVNISPGAQRLDFAGMAASSTLLLGADRGRVDRRRMVDTLIAHVLAHHLPSRFPCNLYYAHHSAVACSLAGGEAWTRWNETAAAALIAGQRRDDACFAGSWDFEGGQFHGHRTGRLLSTALACLVLEAPYRFSIAKEKPGR